MLEKEEKRKADERKTLRNAQLERIKQQEKGIEALNEPEAPGTAVTSHAQQAPHKQDEAQQRVERLLPETGKSPPQQPPQQPQSVNVAAMVPQQQPAQAQQDQQEQQAASDENDSEWDFHFFDEYYSPLDSPTSSVPSNIALKQQAQQQQPQQQAHPHDFLPHDFLNDPIFDNAAHGDGEFDDYDFEGHNFSTPLLSGTPPKTGVLQSTNESLLETQKDIIWEKASTTSGQFLVSSKDAPNEVVPHVPITIQKSMQDECDDIGKAVVLYVSDIQLNDTVKPNNIIQQLNDVESGTNCAFKIPGNISDDKAFKLVVFKTQNTIIKGFIVYKEIENSTIDDVTQPYRLNDLTVPDTMVIHCMWAHKMYGGSILTYFLKHYSEDDNKTKIQTSNKLLGENEFFREDLLKILKQYTNKDVDFDIERLDNSQPTNEEQQEEPKSSIQGTSHAVQTADTAEVCTMMNEYTKTNLLIQVERFEQEYNEQVRNTRQRRVQRPVTRNDTIRDVDPDALKKIQTKGEQISSDLAGRIMAHAVNYEGIKLGPLIVEIIDRRSNTILKKLRVIGNFVDNVTNQNEMLVPLHISNNHFVIAKVNIAPDDTKITIKLYDSLKRKHTRFQIPLKICISVLATFIVYKRSKNERFSNYKDLTFDVTYAVVPPQLDVITCGLFQSVFLIYLLNNDEVPQCICIEELKWCVDNRNNRTKYETFIAALRENFASFYSDTTTSQQVLFDEQVQKFTCRGQEEGNVRGGSTRNKQVVQLGQSFRPGKKFMVQMGSTTVHFGQKGAYDFTRRGKDAHNIERKKRYIKRHAEHEDWTKRGMHTAGFWARWILWNKPSKRASIRDVEAKYNLHIVPFSIK